MLKDRLKEARLRRGLTQTDVAEKMGVVGSTISSYETGRSEPDMRQLTQLVGILGVDANWLLQDEMADDSRPQRIELSEDETELLALFRSMNASSRSAALVTVRLMAGSPDARKGKASSEMA